MEIINEDGKIWGIKKDYSYGVCHITKYYLGEDKKKTKKKNEKNN